MANHGTVQALLWLALMAAAGPAAGADAPEPPDTAPAADGENAAEANPDAIRLRPSIEIAYGAETNYFEDAGVNELTKVLRTRAGMKFGNSEEADLQVEGEAFASRDHLSGANSRPVDTFGGEINFTKKIGDSAESNFGAAYEAEDFSDPPTRTASAYSGMRGEMAKFEWEIRSTFLAYREDISQAEIEEEDLEDFDRNETGSILRVAYSFTDALKPFAELQYGGIDYLNNRPGFPQRDSLRLRAAIGVGYEIADKLEAEFAVVHESRSFRSAPDYDGDALFSPVASLTWTPVEWLTLLASYDRTFEDTTNDDSYVYDTQTIILGAEVRPVETVKAEVGAQWTIYDEKPVDRREQETMYSGRLAWLPQPGMEYYVSASATQYRYRETPEDDYDNYIFFSGARFEVQ